MTRKSVKFFVDDITAPWGLEQAVIRLANNLSNHGHDVSVVSFFSVSSPVAFDIDRKVAIKHLNLTNTLIDDSYIKRLNGFMGLIRAVVREVKGANIIISASSFISVALPLCKMIPGNQCTNLIAWEHGVYDSVGKVLKIFRAFMYKYIDNIVVLTQSQQNVYQKHNFMMPKVIPNEAPKINIEFHKIEKRKTFISAGRLSFEKGFDVLISDIYPLLITNPEWKLEIYGDGPMQKELEDLIANLDIGQQVKLYSRTPSVIQKLSTSYIYLMASRYESFGLILIEAQICGLPVVAYDCESGPREIIHHGKDGFLIPSGRADMFREAVKKLIEDDYLYNSMSTQARQSSLAFDGEDIYAKWSEIFNQSDHNRKGNR